MKKFRNWLAKKIGDFAIEHIADPEYSRNLKKVITLGTYTWEQAVKEKLEKESLPH